MTASLPAVSRPSRQPDWTSDRGTVLMLMVGLLPVLFMTMAASIDAGVLFTQRRSLSALADESAIAGAQAADLASIYSGRSEQVLPIDCVRARRVILGMVGRTQLQRRSRVAVATTSCDGTNVGVSLKSNIELPFFGSFGVSPEVTVRASAKARSPLS